MGLGRRELADALAPPEPDTTLRIRKGVMRSYTTGVGATVGIDGTDIAGVTVLGAAPPPGEVCYLFHEGASWLVLGMPVAT